MAKEEKLLVQKRTETGSTAVRRLRRTGLVPGVIYGDKSAGMSIQLEAHSFEQMLLHHSSENLILDVQVEKAKPKKMLLKDVQHDVITGHVLHVDFVEISMTEIMRVRIPVELVGEPVGVSQDGGILDHLLREIEVECLPTDLVDRIELDVSDLAINDSIRVAGLSVSDKLVVLTADDVAVASVSPPRLEEEVEAEPVEGEEGAEAAEGEEGGEASEKKEGAEEAAAEKDEKKEPKS